jgi:hypothetical protein
MSDNIIDFNKHRREHMESQSFSEVSLQTLLNRLTSVPQNDLMADVADSLRNKMTRLLIMTDIASKASDMLSAYGFDPNNFYLDEESLNRYLSGDMPEDEQAFWNGPFFDWDADDERDTTVRVVSTVRVIDEDEDDTSIQLGLEIFKLGRNDERWQRFVDGEWLQDGPPADIFDTLGYEDFTDWDEVEDDDDDAPDGEPRGDDDWDWDDDDMSSIYMYDFSPAAMKALTLAGIETVDQIKAMSDGQLAAIPGLDEKDVRRIKKVLSFDR